MPKKVIFVMTLVAALTVTALAGAGLAFAQEPTPIRSTGLCSWPGPWLVLWASCWGLGLSRWLTAPLARLTAAAHRIASGDLSQRVPETGSDGVVALGQAFNLMAVELEKAEELRHNVVADVAHELRTSSQCTSRQPASYPRRGLSPGAGRERCPLQ